MQYLATRSQALREQLQSRLAPTCTEIDYATPQAGERASPSKLDDALLREERVERQLDPEWLTLPANGLAPEPWMLREPGTPVHRDW